MGEKISNSIYLGFGTLEIILLVWIRGFGYVPNYWLLWLMPVFLLAIPCVRRYKNTQEHSVE